MRWDAGLCLPLSKSFSPFLQKYLSFFPLVLSKKGRDSQCLSLSYSLFQTPILKWNLCKRELEQWSIMNNSVIEEYTHNYIHTCMSCQKMCPFFTEMWDDDYDTKKTRPLPSPSQLHIIHLSIHSTSTLKAFSPLSWHNTIRIFLS